MGRICAAIHYKSDRLVGMAVAFRLRLPRPRPAPSARPVGAHEGLVSRRSRTETQRNRQISGRSQAGARARQGRRDLTAGGDVTAFAAGSCVNRQVLKRLMGGGEENQETECVSKEPPILPSTIAAHIELRMTCHSITLGGGLGPQADGGSCRCIRRTVARVPKPSLRFCVVLLCVLPAAARHAPLRCRCMGLLRVAILLSLGSAFVLLLHSGLRSHELLQATDPVGELHHVHAAGVALVQHQSPGSAAVGAAGDRGRIRASGSSCPKAAKADAAWRQVKPEWMKILREMRRARAARRCERRGDAMLLVLDLRGAEKLKGHAHEIEFPDYIVADEASGGWRARRSTLQLFTAKGGRIDRPLGPAHAEHEAIGRVGNGAFSHWRSPMADGAARSSTKLRFSTPGNVPLRVLEVA